MTSGGRLLIGSVSEKWYFLLEASKYMREMPSARTLPQPGAAIPPSRIGSSPFGRMVAESSAELDAEARAGRAGAVGVVEGEHARRELLDGDPAAVPLAGVVLKRDVAVLVRNVDDHNALAGAAAVSTRRSVIRCIASEATARQ